MKTASRGKTKPQASFEDEYRSSLREYAEGGGEFALGRAYELGRRALNEKKSLVEIASLHHQAVLGLIRDAGSDKQREDSFRAGSEFLAECLSPYEMAHRGFQDAVKALRQLNETLEEEIKRIAYAVHDDAGQLLVAVHLALDEVARDLPKAQQDQVGQIEGLLNQVEKHLRRYSHELRPTILDDLGWVPAIRFLAEGISKRSDPPIHIQATVSHPLPRARSTALYRTVQEGLTNAIKHAKASNIWIRAWKENLVRCCSVRDDGDGFDSGQVRATAGPKGLGLIGMQERGGEIGGTLRIQSSPGPRTELSIPVPLQQGHANTRSARG